MKTLIIIFCLCAVTFGYNILVIFPHEGKSHQKVFEPVVRQLAARGHTITAIAQHALGVNSNNYREIILKYQKTRAEDAFDLDLFDVSLRILSMLTPIILTNDGIDCCHAMFSDADVKSLITSDEKFDLIIAELFNSECALAFVDKFRSPLISVSSTTIMAWHTERFGQPDNPSYIGNTQYWHGKKLDFVDRLENMIGVIWYKAVHWYCVRKNQMIAEAYFGKKLTSFYDIMQNTSLFLVNSHSALNIAKPLVPGIIEIGGAHITKQGVLPQNIEKFINESTHGVIYFSLGSMIKGHTFPQDKREEFLRAFARLPQRVLWKWENETMPGKPDNVMIQKWMPQFDILSHPNVKAFISHGGLLGTTEAVHCGVPMLVMPQYGDQHTNAKAIEANGGGVILYLKEATEEKVYQSLKTLLSPEFRVKAKALSERFRDRPMSPMDTAIYWVEYVARHKGAPHLRTAAVDMPLYQYLLLDVIAFLAIILIIFAYITYKIISLILKALFSKKKVKQS